MGRNRHNISGVRPHHLLGFTAESDNIISIFQSLPRLALVKYYPALNITKVLAVPKSIPISFKTPKIDFNMPKLLPDCIK